LHHLAEYSTGNLTFVANKYAIALHVAGMDHVGNLPVLDRQLVLVCRSPYVSIAHYTLYDSLETSRSSNNKQAESIPTFANNDITKFNLNSQAPLRIQ